MSRSGSVNNEREYVADISITSIGRCSPTRPGRTSGRSSSDVSGWRTPTAIRPARSSFGCGGRSREGSNWIRRTVAIPLSKELRAARRKHAFALDPFMQMPVLLGARNRRNVRKSSCGYEVANSGVWARLSSDLLWEFAWRKPDGTSNSGQFKDINTRSGLEFCGRGCGTWLFLGPK